MSGRVAVPSIVRSDRGIVHEIIRLFGLEFSAFTGSPRLLIAREEIDKRHGHAQWLETNHASVQVKLC